MRFPANRSISVKSDQTRPETILQQPLKDMQQQCAEQVAVKLRFVA
jgi:hypothetical protein